MFSLQKIGMVQFGTKSENGPSTKQKVFTKIMWLLGTCRNAIVVVATGALGFWFVASYGESPVRLMGQYSLTMQSYFNDQLFDKH